MRCFESAVVMENAVQENSGARILTGRNGIASFLMASTRLLSSVIPCEMRRPRS